jgi:hypothetical protein
MRVRIAPRRDGRIRAQLRQNTGNKQFFSEVGEDGLNHKRFRTSGNVVTVLTVLTLLAYISLLVLTLRLGV